MASYPTDWATLMQPALAGWISSQLALVAGGPYTVLWADQDAPRANKPFVTLKRIGAPVPEGTPYDARLDLGDTITLSRRVAARLILEVQLYSDTESLVAAERIRVSGGFTSVREQLEVAGIKLPESFQMRDLSGLFSGRREWRYVAEIPLGIELRVDNVNQPWIETVAPPVLQVLE